MTDKVKQHLYNREPSTKSQRSFFLSMSIAIISDCTDHRERRDTKKIILNMIMKSELFLLEFAYKRPKNSAPGIFLTCCVLHSDPFGHN